MAKKRSTSGKALTNVGDYRHGGTKRKNIPPAKLAAEGAVPVLPKIEYSYSPRRPPVLRFDSSGDADTLPALLSEAAKRRLTEDEVSILADALRSQEPWLEWAGKREMPSFVVDPVALHIHERVSAQAILKIAARQDVERTLFGDPEQEYHEAVQFYRHDITWTNRVILGDSLQVMASLAKREDLAGKVQMIYIDPPYGIRFGSNFQPLIGNRDVKDKPSDLTREPEQIKAYRDTWHLGIHSYLTYLRDRLITARELLSDTGSIFVQIGDENVHLVRNLLDEVFGGHNACSLISYTKTTTTTGRLLPGTQDFILWYAKNSERVKFKQLHGGKSVGGYAGGNYTSVEEESGFRRPMTSEERDSPDAIPPSYRCYRFDNLTSPRVREARSGYFEIEFAGTKLFPRTGEWKTNREGIGRLLKCNRIGTTGDGLYYVRYLEDFPAYALNNSWTDTVVAGFASQKMYAVETNAKVIARCLLMTTDPGDLVLDPTGGSGTTAQVAEQWGRRWIIIDTSRVAVAIARQRLLTAKYDYYQLRNPKVGIAGNLVYRTVPHITLKSIAQNPNLDPILAKHDRILDGLLNDCNKALAPISPDERTRLAAKLSRKERQEGRRSITDADKRRWHLPDKGSAWEHWSIPFDTDPEWTEELQKAVTEYRAAWRAKMHEVNTCVANNAEQEELIDQPLPDKTVKLRVTGPFTMESVQPPELSIGDVLGKFDGGPPELEDTFPMQEAAAQPFREAKNVEAYLDEMTKLLRLDGVRFPNNKEMNFTRLSRLIDPSGLHAEGRWAPKGEPDNDPDGEANVGIVFGPQYGPVTVQMLEKLIKPAKRRYDALVIAAFNFTAEVQDLAENHQVPDFRIHVAHVAPSVNPGMKGLLKEQPGSHLFTVFGQPRTRLEGPDERGDFVVVMEGVDIYDPVQNLIRSTEDTKVAAWFLDGDYDGRTFCVTQAFFPDKAAWEKLSRALNGVVDPDRFEALTGTKSLPFPPGKHRSVAVKVIDPRGNEVMQVHRLEVAR